MSVTVRVQGTVGAPLTQQQADAVTDNLNLVLSRNALIVTPYTAPVGCSLG